MKPKRSGRRKRKHIPLKVQLAAALLQNPYGINYLDSKSMTADQIISLYELDHYPIRHADGGVDEPWNLTWRFIGEHRAKTKRDMKEMAKTRRIQKAYARRAATPKRRIPSRPFPKRPKT